MSKQRDKDDFPDAPDAFTCSITYCRMVDPVITADGHSYERLAIEEWFKNKSTSLTFYSLVPLFSSPVLCATSKKCFKVY